jgi:hypothetical protein
MRVEISRISGDIYINGQKRVFAVDFKAAAGVPEFSQVDWLLGWAKIGLMSHGYTVPHFEITSTKEFERIAALPATEEPAPEESGSLMK